MTPEEPAGTCGGSHESILGFVKNVGKMEKEMYLYGRVLKWVFPHIVGQ
jgi:hypothetical protein